MEKVYVIVLSRIEDGREHWEHEYIHKTLDGAKEKASNCGYEVGKDHNRLYIRGVQWGYIEEMDLGR